MATSIFDEPKIDCHNHVFDPARFPYAADTPYRPAGQEVGTAAQMLRLFDAYGVRHGLLVGPNSGYGTDNRALLDALALGAGRLKGIAVVPNSASEAELERLRSAGVVGIAFNPTFHGMAYYADAEPLLHRLRDLGMFAQLQVEGDMMAVLEPALVRSGVRLLVDHCGRPTVHAGLQQPGFQAVLRLADTGRAAVKLSGYAKFSRESSPHADALPYVRALVDAFTLEACVWGSDWPFLRAPERIDYGVLLRLVEQLFPVAAERRKLLWDTPHRLFGFAPAVPG